MLTRRPILRLIPALLASGALAIPAIASAQEQFPSSPVTIVVPFPPGGATDFVARTLAQSLSKEWKVPVIVENRAGAGGNIAADYVARAPATGNTILLGAVSIVTNPPLYKTAPYVPRVLTPVGVGVSAQLVTIARPDFPARDIPAMLALSATKPLNGASAGAGTLSHLGLELLTANHKGQITHIPYKGSTPALTDVMGSQVDVMIDTVASSAPMIASGKVKALAVHTPRRSNVLPNVPTYEEQGLKDMSFGAWNVFFVPVGTPADRIATLNAAMARAVRDPATSKIFADRGLDSVVQSPAESLEFMRNDAQRWEKLVKDRNITL